MKAVEEDTKAGRILRKFKGLLLRPPELQQTLRDHEESSYLTWLTFAPKILNTLGEDIKHGTILDAGCAGGGITTALAKDNEKAFVVGVDIRKDFVSLARRLAISKNVVNISFACCDIHHLCFRSESFDMYFSNATLEHVADPSACLREMYRVLRHKGLARIYFHHFWGPFGGHLHTLPFPYVQYLPKRLVRLLLTLTPKMRRIPPKNIYEDFLELNRWSSSDLMTVANRMGFISVLVDGGYLPGFRSLAKFLGGRLHDLFCEGFTCLLKKQS